jgi:hypothetical protein
MNFPELRYWLHNLPQHEPRKLPWLGDSLILRGNRSGGCEATQSALRNSEGNLAQKFATQGVNLKLRQSGRLQRGALLLCTEDVQGSGLHLTVSLQRKGDRIING